MSNSIRRRSKARNRKRNRYEENYEDPKFRFPFSASEDNWGDNYELDDHDLYDYYDDDDDDDEEDDSFKILDVLPVTTLSLTRYSYKSWMKCYPDSNRSEYEEKQMPRDFLGYAATALANIVGKNMPDDDMEIRAVMIDDDYFKWLGNREDTTETRSKYPGTVSKDKSGPAVIANGLAVTDRLYGIPIDVASDKSKMDARISAETAEEVTKYIKGLIRCDKFDVLTLPFFVKCDTFVNEYEHLSRMAEECLKTGLKKRNGKFEELSFKTVPGGVTAAMIILPVFVRENHPQATVTVKDVFSYLDQEEAFVHYNDNGKLLPEAAGRWLNIGMWSDRESMDFYGKEGVPLFPGSAADKAIRQELAERFGELPTEVISCAALPEDAVEIYGEYMNEMNKALKKAGKKNRWV